MLNLEESSYFQVNNSQAHETILLADTKQGTKNCSEAPLRKQSSVFYGNIF